MYELIRHYFREVCKHLAKARLLALSKSLGEGGLGGRGFNVDGKKKFFVDRISSNKRPHPRPQCQTSVPFE